MILKHQNLLVSLSLIKILNENESEIETLFFKGILCCSVGVFFFASPLIKLKHVIQTRNSSSLPFPIIVASFFVTLQWFIYGYIIGDSFIQVRENSHNFHMNLNSEFFFRFQTFLDVFYLQFNSHYS
jgi:uncharacterized protein with PQ loop repeat